MARARTNPWLVLLVLTTGFFMIMLDTTIVNVAIPAMSTALNTTLDQILWVLNAYVLVYAVLLITAGRLGDLYGQRSLFAIGLFIFTVASALCGLSQDPAQLIADLLDTTIVNVAIPAMSTALNTTLDQILWVLNAYVLVYAVLLITAGRLGDLYGQRSLFAIGLFIFTVASALCGLSQDPAQLIAARILQGVGGALLTPQTLAILTSIFPPERRGAAFGIWGGVAGLATVAGPTLGGAIITYIDWRWIFYINVPIG